MEPKPAVANLVERDMIPKMLKGDFPVKSETGTETSEALPVIATHCHP